MKRNVRWGAWAVVMLGLLGVSTAAHATSLPPGNTVSVTNLTSFSGTILGVTTLPYSITGGNTGTVREWVVSNASTALCAGCLSFVYQVQVTGGTATRIAGSPYDAFMVDVSHFNNDPNALGTVIGTFGANNADRDASGNIVGFNYTSPITSTFASFLEIANTNATAFQSGTVTITAGTAGSQSFTTGFAPGTPTVPEPATILLLGSSLVALGVWRRRT